MNAGRDLDQVAGSHLIPLGDGWQAWRLAVLRSAGMPFELLASLCVDELRVDEAAIRAKEGAAVNALLADDTGQGRSRLRWPRSRKAAGSAGSPVRCGAAGARGTGAAAGTA